MAVKLAQAKSAMLDVELAGADLAKAKQDAENAAEHKQREIDQLRAALREQAAAAVTEKAVADAGV